MFCGAAAAVLANSGLVDSLAQLMEYQKGDDDMMLQLCYTFYCLVRRPVPSIIERRPALFFLGHISPIFAPFFLVFSRFSPS